MRGTDQKIGMSYRASLQVTLKQGDCPRLPNYLPHLNTHHSGLRLPNNPSPFILLPLQRGEGRDFKEGRSPSSTISPPLLSKERGIKEVRLIKI
jgi:hypothetical protein